MPIDNEKIKKALDDFENDNFMDAKATLKKEIGDVVKDYYKDKLELTKDLEPKDKEVNTGTDTKDDTGADDDADGSE